VSLDTSTASILDLRLNRSEQLCSLPRKSGHSGSRSTFVCSRPPFAPPPSRAADVRRFCNIYDHWLRGLRTEDRSREIGVRLLGVVGTRHDDHPGIRYAGPPSRKSFPRSVSTRKQFYRMPSRPDISTRYTAGYSRKLSRSTARRRRLRTRRTPKR